MTRSHATRLLITQSPPRFPRIDSWLCFVSLLCLSSPDDSNLAFTFQRFTASPCTNSIYGRRNAASYTPSLGLTLSSFSSRPATNTAFRRGRQGRRDLLKLAGYSRCIAAFLSTPLQSHSMHHSRRKSGHGLGNTSMTDVRKATSTSDSKHRSSTKQTTSSRRSGGSLPSSKSSKTLSSRDAEKPREDDYYYDDERESFPQFWYVALVFFPSFFVVIFLISAAGSLFCPCSLSAFPSFAFLLPHFLVYPNKGLASLPVSSTCIVT